MKRLVLSNCIKAEGTAGPRAHVCVQPQGRVSPQAPGDLECPVRILNLEMRPTKGRRVEDDRSLKPPGPEALSLRRLSLLPGLRGLLGRAGSGPRWRALQQSALLLPTPSFASFLQKPTRGFSQ